MLALGREPVVSSFSGCQGQPANLAISPLTRTAGLVLLGQLVMVNTPGISAPLTLENLAKPDLARPLKECTASRDRDYGPWHPEQHTRNSSSSSCKFRSILPHSRLVHGIPACE